MNEGHSNFGEDIEKLNLIYEAFLTPRKASGQQDSTDGKHSYRKGTFSTPQGSVNQYQVNQISQTTQPIDEEDEAKKNPVEILQKIDDLLAEAEGDGMQYAIHQLGTLKKFITGKAD